MWIHSVRRTSCRPFVLGGRGRASARGTVWETGHLGPVLNPGVWPDDAGWATLHPEAMPAPSDRSDRPHRRRAHVDALLAIRAGSTAWSQAGRGALLRPEHHVPEPSRVELGDRAFPIVHRN